MKPPISDILMMPLTLLLTFVTTLTQGCPEFCYCFNGMATCSDFRVLDLTLLPADTSTLVLSRGELEEIPPAFLARARSLSMLEILSISARVVRGGAFRGIGNLDFFSITNCTFDIVEPEGLSGLHDVERIHISDSLFGRVGRHGLAEISSVLEFRFWNNKFEYISDEAFYRLTDVLSVQMFQNNITYLGANVFKCAVEVDDVNIFSNYIKVAEKGCLDDLTKVAIRMAFYHNEFECSCNLVWMLNSPDHWREQNKCIFPGTGPSSESTFRVADLPELVMCPRKPTTSQSPPTEKENVNSRRFDLTDVFYSDNETDPLLPEYTENGLNSSDVSNFTSPDSTADSVDGIDNAEYESDKTEILEFVDFVEIYPAEDLDAEYYREDTPAVKENIENNINNRDEILATSDYVLLKEERTESDNSEYPLSATEAPFNDSVVPDYKQEEGDDGRVASVLGEGLRDKEHAKPYATSAVEMETTNSQNAATGWHSSISLISVLTVSLVFMECVRRSNTF